MTGCAVTTGFFVLGHCGRAAVAGCRCGRPVCAEHVDAQGSCPECAAAIRYFAGPYDPAWTYGYRRWYYQYSAYQYQDAYWYAGFDAYDRRPFAPGAGHSGDYPSDDVDGWVDS